MTLLSPEGRSQLVTELRDLAIECRRTTLAGRPRTVEINARVLDGAADAIECWQPIETAPKDGTMVLLYGPILGREHPFCTSGYWKRDFDYTFKFPDGRGAWTDDTVSDWGNQENTELAPTHWMPLPEPPTP